MSSLFSFEQWKPWLDQQEAEFAISKNSEVHFPEEMTLLIVGLEFIYFLIIVVLYYITYILNMISCPQCSFVKHFYYCKNTDHTKVSFDIVLPWVNNLLNLIAHLINSLK